MLQVGKYKILMRRKVANPGPSYEINEYFFSRDYQATLEVVCEKGSRDNYGLLNWTVAQETDDLVYYHSYTHEVQVSE